MNKVIVDGAEFSASNAIIEWLAAASRSSLRTHAGYAFEGGTMVGQSDGVAWLELPGIGEYAAPVGYQKRSCKKVLRKALQNRPDSPSRSTCDKASSAAAVMLHLRSCYVSKAAILTIPVRSVPVENRSPA